MSSLVKCKPALGGDTAPICLAKMVWKRSLSNFSTGRFIYLGMGISPNFSINFQSSSSAPSNKNLIVRPRDVVLSTTSATNVSSPKYSLLPTRILRAGSTNTSHNFISLFNSRNKKTSILAPVFSLLPYKRAGKTLVLLFIITSLSSKYFRMSLNALCSIFPFLRSSTIILLS